MEQISVPFFRSIWGPPLVRALLDWDRIEKECTCSLELYGGLEVLNSVYLPWYKNSEGALAEYDHSDARPMTPQEASESLEIFSERRQSFIHISHGYFVSNKGMLQLTIPAYDVGNGRRVSLDNSHRLTALSMLARQPQVRLLFMTLHGPIDSSLVADLTYWQRKLAVPQ